MGIALTPGAAADLPVVRTPARNATCSRPSPESATFLPAVWKSLPEPRDFLEALRRKAGLAPGHWSPTLRFERYTVTEAD